MIVWLYVGKDDAKVISINVKRPQNGLNVRIKWN